MCDRIVVIDHGNIIADDTEENLSKTLSQEHRLIVQIDGPRNEVMKMLEGISGVKKLDRLKSYSGDIADYLIETDEKSDVRRELFEKISSNGWCMLGLKTQELSLEDIFLKLTMGENIKGFKKAKKEAD